VTFAADAGARSAIEPWIQAAKPTHISLLDPDLTVADLYGVRNVPAAFWIDETGRIVRANDPIYAQRRDPASGQVIRNDRYLDAIRDWVAKGAASRFLQDDVALDKRRRTLSLADVEAQTSFQLGLFIARRGDIAGAQRHFDRARQLAPDLWTFRRQAWSLTGTDQKTVIEAIRDPGAPAFYPDLDLPD
jgi:hypothetical protein